MASIITFQCPKCSESFRGKAYTLTCMHNFCKKCILEKKGNTKTTCVLCGSSTLNRDITENAFLGKMSSFEILVDKIKHKANDCDTCKLSKKAEKYCVDCCQHICSKCSLIHARTKTCENHKIVDKDNVSLNSFVAKDTKCKEHSLDFSLFCKDCEVLICSSCRSQKHAKHAIDEDVKLLVGQSKRTILHRLTRIDENVKTQNNLLYENNKIETEFIANVREVREKYSRQVEKLKEKIEIESNTTLEKLLDNRTAFENYSKTNSTEINNYLLSSHHHKSYLDNVVKYGSNVDLLNLKKDIDKSVLVKAKDSKLHVKDFWIVSQPSFNVDSFKISDLFGSILMLKLDGKINKRSLEILNKIESVSVIKNDLYIFSCPIINVYDMISHTCKPSIDFTQLIRKENLSMFIITNDIFIYFNVTNTEREETVIYKYGNLDQKFLKWKRMDPCHFITSSQQTILATTLYNEIFELSLGGDKLKNIIIPKEAITPRSILTCSYKLEDQKYVVLSRDQDYVSLSLLDLDGSFIESTILPTFSNIVSCTDGREFVFVLEIITGTIAVFSTDLVCQYKFDIPNAELIYYDQDDERLFVVTNEDILSLKFDETIKKRMYNSNF